MPEYAVLPQPVHTPHHIDFTKNGTGIGRGGDTGMFNGTTGAMDLSGGEAYGHGDGHIPHTNHSHDQGMGAGMISMPPAVHQQQPRSWNPSTYWGGS